MIYDGSKTVITAGTRVALSSTEQPCSMLAVQAVSTNTGSIWLGGPTVAANRGLCLLKGDVYEFPAQDINTYHLEQICIDATVNGEGVTFLYEVR